jgi:hypothetical protein
MGPRYPGSKAYRCERTQRRSTTNDTLACVGLPSRATTGHAVVHVVAGACGTVAGRSDLVGCRASPDLRLVGLELVVGDSRHSMRVALPRTLDMALRELHDSV